MIGKINCYYVFFIINFCCLIFFFIYEKTFLLEIISLIIITHAKVICILFTKKRKSYLYKTCHAQLRCFTSRSSWSRCVNIAKVMISRMTQVIQKVYIYMWMQSHIMTSYVARNLGLGRKSVMRQHFSSMWYFGKLCYLCFLLKKE